MRPGGLLRTGDPAPLGRLTDNSSGLPGHLVHSSKCPTRVTAEVSPASAAFPGAGAETAPPHLPTPRQCRDWVWRPEHSLPFSVKPRGWGGPRSRPSQVSCRPAARPPASPLWPGGVPPGGAAPAGRTMRSAPYTRDCIPRTGPTDAVRRKRTRRLTRTDWKPAEHASGLRASSTRLPDLPLLPSPPRSLSPATPPAWCCSGHRTSWHLRASALAALRHPRPSPGQPRAPSPIYSRFSPNATSSERSSWSSP